MGTAAYGLLCVCCRCVCVDRASWEAHCRTLVVARETGPPHSTTLPCPAPPPLSQCLLHPVHTRTPSRHSLLLKAVGGSKAEFKKEGASVDYAKTKTKQGKAE